MKEEGETRLKSEDTPFDVIHKLSEGNPAAFQVCMDIMEKGEIIDPNPVLGGLGALLLLDSYQIYAARIWLLYKDVCGEDVVKTIAILRALQLGFLDQDKLNHAIDHNGDGIDVDRIKQQVKVRLSAFLNEEEKGVKK